MPNAEIGNSIRLKVRSNKESPMLTRSEMDKERPGLEIPEVDVAGSRWQGALKGRKKPECPRSSTESGSAGLARP